MVAIVPKPPKSKNNNIYDYPRSLTKEQLKTLQNEAKRNISESKLDIKDDDIKEIIISNCYDQSEAKSIIENFYEENIDQYRSTLFEWFKIIVLKRHNKISSTYKKYNNNQLYDKDKLTEEEAKIIIYEASYDKDPSVTCESEYSENKNASYYYLTAAYEKASDKKEYEVPSEISNDKVYFIKEFMLQKSSWTTIELDNFVQSIENKEHPQDISKVVSYIIEFNSYPEDTTEYFREKKLLNNLGVINNNEGFLEYIEKNYNMIKGLHENNKNRFCDLANSLVLNKKTKDTDYYEAMFLDLMPSELMFFSDKNSLLSKADKVSLRILKNLKEIMKQLTFDDYKKTMLDYSPDMGDMIFHQGKEKKKKSVYFLENYPETFLASGYENFEIEYYKAQAEDLLNNIKKDLFYTESTTKKNQHIPFEKEKVMLSDLRAKFKAMKKGKDLKRSLFVIKEIEALVGNPSLLKNQVFLSQEDITKFECKKVEGEEINLKNFLGTLFPKISNIIINKAINATILGIPEGDFETLRETLSEEKPLNEVDISIDKSYIKAEFLNNALRGMQKYIDFIKLLKLIEGSFAPTQIKKIKAKLPLLTKTDIEEYQYLSPYIDKLGLDDTPKDIQKEAMDEIGNLIIMFEPLKSFCMVNVYAKIVKKIRSTAKDRLNREVIVYIPDEINDFFKGFVNSIDRCEEKRIVSICVDISYLKNLVLKIQRDFPIINLNVIFNQNLSENIKNCKDICFLSEYVGCENYQTIQPRDLLKISNLYRNSKPEIQSKIEDCLRNYDTSSLSKQKINFLIECKGNNDNLGKLDDFCAMIQNDTVYDFFDKAESKTHFLETIIKSKGTSNLAKDPSKAELLRLYLMVDCDDDKYKKILEYKKNDYFKYSFLLTVDDKEQILEYLGDESKFPSLKWGKKEEKEEKEEKKVTDFNISFLPKDKDHDEYQLNFLEKEYKSISEFSTEETSEDLLEKFKDPKLNDLSKNIKWLMTLAQRDLGQTLTEYQIKAILNDTNFHMPTGTGKTLTMVIKSLLEWKKGRNVIIEVPNKTLINQFFQNFGAFLTKCDVGFTIGADKLDVEKPKIILATYSDSYGILQNSSTEAKVTRIVDEYDAAAHGKESAAKSISLDGYKTQIKRKKLISSGLKDDNLYKSIYDESKRESEILEEDRDYYVENRKIVPIIDGQKKPGFVFANFTHGFLELRHGLDISEFSISYWTSNYSSFVENSNIKLIGCSATYNERENTPSINFSRVDDNNIIEEKEFKEYKQDIILAEDATIIFCQDHKHAQQYYDKMNKECNIKTPVLSEKDGKACKNDKEIYIDAGKAGKRTILTLTDARGLDIKPEGNVTLHVIDLTGSVDEAEIKQIKGRTGRFGRKGKYTKIKNINYKPTKSVIPAVVSSIPKEKDQKSRYFHDYKVDIESVIPAVVSSMPKETDQKSRYFHDYKVDIEKEIKSEEKNLTSLENEIGGHQKELTSKQEELESEQKKLKELHSKKSNQVFFTSPKTNKQIITSKATVKTLEGNINTLQSSINKLQENKKGMELQPNIARLQSTIRDIEKKLLNKSSESGELEKFKYSIGYEKFKNLESLDFQEEMNKYSNNQANSKLLLSKYIVLRFAEDGTDIYKNNNGDKDFEIEIKGDIKGDKDLEIETDGGKTTLKIKEKSIVYYALLDRIVKINTPDEKKPFFTWLEKEEKEHEDLFKKTSNRYLSKAVLIMSLSTAMLGIPLGIYLNLLLISYITAGVSALMFISALCFNYSISQVESCIDLKPIAEAVKAEAEAVKAENLAQKRTRPIIEGYDGRTFISTSKPAPQN